MIQSLTLIHQRSIFLYILIRHKQNKIQHSIMQENEFLQTEEAIVEALRTVYDPEIPVNIYDLGLIYNIETDDENNVLIEMTFTAPSCPMADYILEDVQMKVQAIKGVASVKVDLVFEPEWNKDMMSEEAKLELGFL